ncbi:hypothetical protein U1Q18_027659 [Sarracenia purpurea var. burkii]
MVDTRGSEDPSIRLPRSAGMTMAVDWALRPYGAARPSTLTRSLSARLCGFDFFISPCVFRDPFQGFSVGKLETLCSAPHLLGSVSWILLSMISHSCQ